MSTRPAATSWASNPVTTSKMISFEQQFFINNTDGGEFVNFTGQLHVVTTVFPTDPTFPNDPIIPNDPVRIQTNVINLSGVGEESGLIYGVTGASSDSFAQPFRPGDPYNILVTYRLLPPNPIQPIDNFLNFGYTLQFNSIGELTDAEASILVVEGP